MREIKFRAWDKNKKIMFIPNVLTFGEKGMEVSERLPDWDMRDEVNAEIMQYTGLKDKNGKEIYEGDIVVNNTTLGKGIKCEVVYSFGDCGFILRSIPKKIHYGNPHVFEFIEIIGNIYEHPNLLSQ